MARNPSIFRFRAIVGGISLALACAFAWPLAASATIVLPLSQPTWSELTSQQRQILLPLAGEWDQLESFRRKKWLGIAQRYPTMSPDEQQRIQRRMKEWVALSPADRQRARDVYKNVQKASPDQREAVKQAWQHYKGLPNDEKERLRLEALRKDAPKKPAKPPVPAAGSVAPKPPLGSLNGPAFGQSPKTAAPVAPAPQPVTTPQPAPSNPAPTP